MIIKTTRQVSILFMTLLLGLINGKLVARGDSVQVILNNLLFEKAQSLRFEKPDSAIYLFDLCYHNYLEKKDTANAIQSLKVLANIYGHQANYKESYDKLWRALFLADEAKMEAVKALIYIDIGRYYSFYKRKEKALSYFELSLATNKKLVKMGAFTTANLVKNYYALCATFRELNEPQLAKVYLDTCYLFHQPQVSTIDISYLNFEKAFLLKEEKRYTEAIETYTQLLPWIEKNDPAYQVLVFTYMGDTYRELADYSSSESSYKKALQVSKAYNSHIDFSPLVHQKLSDLYFSKGDLLAAFQSLKVVKSLDERFFDSRSENNLPLLEIQDAFRKEKDYQRELIQKQRLSELEHEDKVWLLEKIILFVSIIFLILVGIIYFNYVRSKHRAEKKLIKEKQAMELQKANEIVELKNKELAASALKLIEKDEFLATLKTKLSQPKEAINPKVIKDIVRSISISNAQNWQEFETRFIAVNKGFYLRLNENFPSLTQGDQKLCALIKLNFSSKDIAKLMGISVESVHTTRYRLRKKLNLSREDNLSGFIANL